MRAAEILAASGDEDGLTLDAVIGHFGLLGCRLSEARALSALSAFKFRRIFLNIVWTSRGGSQRWVIDRSREPSWDGIRPRLGRDVVERHQARIGQLGILAATENLEAPTDWAFEEDHHVYRRSSGRPARPDGLRIFGRTFGARCCRSRGDVWMIPAACRYAALAQGERAEFVEFSVPTRAARRCAASRARTTSRRFLLRAAARLFELIRNVRR